MGCRHGFKLSKIYSTFDNILKYAGVNREK